MRKGVGRQSQREGLKTVYEYRHEREGERKHDKEYNRGKIELEIGKKI